MAIQNLTLYFFIILKVIILKFMDTNIQIVNYPEISTYIFSSTPLEFYTHTDNHRYNRYSVPLMIRNRNEGVRYMLKRNVSYWISFRVLMA